MHVRSRLHAVGMIGGSLPDEIQLLMRSIGPVEMVQREHRCISRYFNDTRMLLVLRAM